MLSETAIAIIICILYSICAVCLGALVLRLVARKLFAAGENHTLAVFITAFLLGQGLLAAIWQLLALGGLFSLQVIIGVLALSFLAGVRFAIPIAAGFGRLLRSALRDLWRDSPAWLAAYSLTTFLILMTGVATINPPQPRGDSLAFYMALPKVIASSQHLLPLPGYEAFTQIGLQGELHFAALMSLSGGVAAKMFLWPECLAAAAMLVAIGGKVGLGRRGRWIALAALFTSSAFTNVIWNGKVDVFPAAMGLCAFYWALDLKGEENTETVRLTGLLAGLAVAAKISYLVPLLPGILLILIWRLRVSSEDGSFFSRSSLTAMLPVVLGLGFWMALPLLPNVAKNTVLFGQPLAPLFNTEETTRWMQAWFTPATTSKIILTYPFSLVYGRYWGQEGQLSPLFLAFLPLLVLMPWPKSIKHSKLAQVALAGLIGIVVWTIYSPSAFAPRNILASLLILLLLGARGAEYVVENHKPRSLLLTAIVIASVLVTLLIGISGLMNLTKTGLLLAVGRVSMCDMERYRSDATCRIAEVINEQASPEERIYLASYYRYWFRPDIIQCLNGTEESSELEEMGFAPESWSHLYDHGYRYVVIDRITHDRIFGILDPEETPDWLAVATVFEDDPFVVYRLDASDPSRQPQMICAQVELPVWQVIAVESD